MTPPVEVPVDQDCAQVLLDCGKDRGGEEAANPSAVEGQDLESLDC